eukprot:TRINITY_DN23829_c0_g1_i1.p4 TRINITY_DN23829_c0_g1~~TRINITY_DN23829_c0_g1_i1.p4  ORF type:complete len:126 (-),score=27.99 TRINITY_DN23829_c0_g1_i1:237-614(-)
MGFHALSRTGWGRWVVPDVYGVYMFMAAGIALGAYISVRNLFYSPEVFIRKDTRGSGYPDDPDVVHAALEWKKSIFRSYGELYPWSPFVYNEKYSYVDPAAVREPPADVIQRLKEELAENQKSYI